MLKNYIKIAWRNIKRQPFFNSLNIAGLAIGLTGTLLIGLYIYDELSFDQMFADSDRIYRVNLDMKFGGEDNNYAVIPAPMGGTLQRDLDQIELATRFRTLGPTMLKADGESSSIKEEGVTFVDSSFFEMFGLPLLQGDVKTAFSEPNSLVITQSVAEKHFKNGDAVGKSITLNNNDVYKITGVLAEIPGNSLLNNYKVFLGMLNNDNANSTNWGSLNYQTFVKTLPGADIKILQKPLDNLVLKYVIPWAQNVFPGLTMEQFEASGNRMQYSFMPIKDIHLHSSMVGEMSPNSSIQNVYILFFIAIFLLALAIVNYMNLSTAQSLKRAKEVGIRKTLGSEKSTLIIQFLMESGLVSFLALVLAIFIATLTLPFFNQLAGKELIMPYTKPAFWLVLAGLGVISSFVSGSYPAFFLSRFSPVKVLKGSEISGGSSKIRNTLVVFQFAISVFLIVCTLVVFQQLSFMKNKDVGFQKEQIFVIKDTYILGDQIKAFKDEISQLNQVKSVTASSFLPTPSVRNTKYFIKVGETNSDNSVIMHNWSVDSDYKKTLDLELLTGRFFDKSFSSDSSAVILNESAAKQFGFTPDEAIGQRITTDLGNPDDKALTVIGVLKNFNFESLREEVSALSMQMRSDPGSVIVKLNPGDFSKPISQIESIWNNMAPGQPYSYYFLEDSFNEIYKSEQKLSSIFLTFTILSLLVAGLGLFGLAAFNAEKRTKEIGIRKVMGASVKQIAVALSLDFLKLVCIAILIALPVGWWAMNKWLQDFSYRVDVSWWVFVLASLLVTAIAILTVSFQAIKAALMNPVKSLRSE